MKQNINANFFTMGMITKVKTYTTLSGKKMAVIHLEDLLGEYEIAVFPEVFSLFENVINVGEIVALKGQEEKDPDGTETIIASEIELYSDLANEYTSK